jgi:S-formylglutathione hydrolase FrmB
VESTPASLPANRPQTWIEKKTPLIARSFACWLGFLAPCILFLCAACHRASVPGDHPHTASGVKMTDVHFHSNALGRDVIYRVYLPENPAPGQKLPVVYLLHGGGEGFRNWSNQSEASKYAAKGLILVMPDGDESYWMNEVEAPRKKYEDFVTQDLIADVQSRFPARADRGGRAVVGISMGGFAAVDDALVHPDLFIFAGALSPSIDVPFRQFNVRRIGQWWKFRTIFGPVGSKTRAARDPFELVKTANPPATPYLYIAAGENEPLLGPIRRFVSRLKDRNYAYEFHTKPGGHDWGQWNSQIPGCFDSLESRFTCVSTPPKNP